MNNVVQHPAASMPEWVNFNIAQTFDVDVNPAATIPGLSEKASKTPNPLNGYVHEEDVVRDLVGFFVSELPFMVHSGPPGCGKDSAIVDFHARLNLPLWIVQCSPKTRARDLFCKLVPTRDGGLRPKYGPAYLAAKYGQSLLLSEYNVMDPAEATGLNLLLDGYDFDIDETDERLTVAEGFRTFATVNPVNGPVLVSGRNIMDAANDDRALLVERDFLPPEIEARVVARVMYQRGISDDEDGAIEIADMFVGVANDIRACFAKQTELGGVQGVVLEKPMSTRALVRWVVLNAVFQRVADKGKQPIHYSLARAFTNGLPDDSKAAIHKAVETRFGIPIVY
jgi:cobaltochelatase CobS